MPGESPKIHAFSMEQNEIDAALVGPSQLLSSGGTRARSTRDCHGEPVSYPWEAHQQAQEEERNHSNLQALWHKGRKSYNQKVATYGWLDWLSMFLPCITWLRTYNIREYLLNDVVAGISVGFMVVPQGMSYANLAGLPSVYGLYGAFLPCLTYALFGSSRQLAVGPVAVTSLLIASNLQRIVKGSDEIANHSKPTAAQAPIQDRYNHLAIQLAFLVACLYTGVGVLRLGFVTNFLSHSVISGFTSGAAITIGLSQVKYILGISIPRKDTLHAQVKLYIENMHNFKWQEFIMGVLLIAIMVTMKELGKKYQRLKWMRPLGPITACIIGLCAVYIGKVDTKGIKIIASIPKGLPRPTVDWWLPMPEFVKLIRVAVIVMLVDLLESTSIARALAYKNNYELVPNREITGLGLANFMGAAFNAYTTTGSFSRSAVNNDSGAKTGLACFVTAWVVGFVLLFLTSVFEKLPYNVLGAIVVQAVTGLFDYENAVYLFKVNKLDFMVWCASFFGVLFAGIEIGLGIAIGLAVLIVVYESAFPHTALLGRIPGTGVYRNVKQYPQAQAVPGVLAVRIDAPIYFANTQYIRDRLRSFTERYKVWCKDKGVELSYLVLDFSPVTHIDASGMHALETWIVDSAANGVQVVLCNPNRKVVQSMETAGVIELIGREYIFVSVQDAVGFASRELAERGKDVTPSVVIIQADRNHSSSGASSTEGVMPARS